MIADVPSSLAWHDSVPTALQLFLSHETVSDTTGNSIFHNHIDYRASRHSLRMPSPPPPCQSSLLGMFRISIYNNQEVRVRGMHQVSATQCESRLQHLKAYLGSLTGLRLPRAKSLCGPSRSQVSSTQLSASAGTTLTIISGSRASHTSHHLEPTWLRSVHLQ